MLLKIKSKLGQVLASTICLLSILTVSCQKEKIQIDAEAKIKLKSSSSTNSKIISSKKQNELMEKFALLLSNVIKNDKSVNLFLKKQALRKFNLEYDILYHQIKDLKISDNESLHEKLLKYTDKVQLSEIESLLPLLTIFIPELPGDVSARTWNAESVTPAISTGCIRMGLVSYYIDGIVTEEKAELYPGFPTLVIKINERVVLENNIYRNTDSKVENLRFSTDMFTFEYLSEAFIGDQVKSTGSNVSAKTICTNCPPDTKLLQAYELWLANPSASFWQRDYIYYSISPSSVNGPLDPAFQEHLTNIKFKTGTQAYNKITDQSGDPNAIDNKYARWTEGSYEFILTTLINSSAGLGSTINKLFPVYGPDIFDVTYTLLTATPFRPYYKISDIAPKQYNLNQSIAAWDLKSTGMAWKFIFAEVDPSQTYTHAHMVSSQFASNFGLDFSKLGLKLGGSATFNISNTYTLVTQMDDDQLGEAAMYFYDPVIVRDDVIPNVGPLYEYKDMDTGWAMLNVQPKRVF